MKAIILAAGNGTRMAPLGLTTPKLLLPIQNRTMLDWHMEAIASHVDEAIIIVGPDALGQKIRDYIPSRSWPIPISFTVQDKPQGTAHAINSAAKLASHADRLLCLNGDDVYSPRDIAALVKHDYAVLGQPVEDWNKWGIFQTNPDGTLAHIVEKPDHFIGKLANTGAEVLTPEIFEHYQHLQSSPRGEYEITGLISMLAERHPFQVVEVKDFWLPIGYPWHILDAHEKLADQFDYRIDGRIEDNVTIHGQLSLGKNSIIKSGCYIEGQVIIGDNCEIGPNAYLRGNTVIGDNSKVGYTVEIKNSTVFTNTHIPHQANIADSVIGNHVNVAAGVRTANWRHDEQNVKSTIKGQLVDTGRQKFGAIIGDHVKLGVNTALYPGRKIWPNLTTMPGEIVTKDKME